MRNRWESPLLLLGVAAAGVAAGLLVDGEAGRRRRRAIAETASEAGEAVCDSSSRLAHAIGDSISSATHSVADGVSSAAHSVSDSITGRVSTAATSVKETLADAIESAIDSIGAARGSTLAMAASMLHRKTKAEKLRDSISDGFERVRPSSVSWKDVQNAIANRRPTLKAPAIGGGVALLAVGAGAYLFYFSPNAARRRDRLISGVRGLVSDIGEFAHAAGSELGERDADIQPANDMADLVRNAIHGVAGDESDVHVTLRDGRVVLQGVASPENYDAVVRAASRVAPGFENELQAVST